MKEDRKNNILYGQIDENYKLIVKLSNNDKEDIIIKNVMLTALGDNVVFESNNLSDVVEHYVKVRGQKPQAGLTWQEHVKTRFKEAILKLADKIDEDHFVDVWETVIGWPDEDPESYSLMPFEAANYSVGVIVDGGDYFIKILRISHVGERTVYIDRLSQSTIFIKDSLRDLSPDWIGNKIINNIEAWISGR